MDVREKLIDLLRRKGDCYATASGRRMIKIGG